MKRTAIVCAVAVLAVLLAAPRHVDSQQTPGQPGIQQSSKAQAFDAKAFFEQLRLNGVSMSEGFDARKFFDKLATDGVSDQRPLDAQTFFDRLKTEGVNVPAGFDGKKFFDELATKGVAAPSMVARPGGIPTGAECKTGWNPTGKWDQGLFKKLCEGRM